VISVKVKFISEGSDFTLITGKIYDVLEETERFYRIVDETGEDYLYGKDDFEIIER
jgi:hypothetical protein